MVSNSVSHATASSSSSTSACSGSSHAAENKERRKNIACFTKSECLAFLEENHLGLLKAYFMRAGVDGPLLASLVHPGLGNGIMKELGIDEGYQEILIKAIESALNNN